MQVVDSLRVLSCHYCKFNISRRSWLNFAKRQTMFFLNLFVVSIVFLVYQQLFLLQFVLFFDLLRKIAQLWLLDRTFFLKVFNRRGVCIYIDKAVFVALWYFNAVISFNIAFSVSIYQGNVINTWLITDSLSRLNWR